MVERICKTCDESFETSLSRRFYCKRDCQLKQRYLNTRKCQIKQMYGITLEDYDHLFNEQKGCCAICGIHQLELKKRLHVDHCHTTGEVRGLLCSKCNNAIGLLNDDPDLFIKTAEYLK